MSDCVYFTFEDCKSPRYSIYNALRPRGSSQWPCFNFCKCTECSADSYLCPLLYLALCWALQGCERQDVFSELLMCMGLTEISPTIGKTLSKYINQIMKKNNILNQHGVNAAYKSLHYCKPQRYCNYPQVLWHHSKMHSLVKYPYPDVEIK